MRYLHTMVRVKNIDDLPHLGARQRGNVLAKINGQIHQTTELIAGQITAGNFAQNFGLQ